MISRVGVLDELPLVLGHLVGKAALGVDRADHRKAAALEHLVVLLAEAGGDVHDAAAVLGGDVGRVVGAKGALGRQLLEVGEQRLVADPFQVAALEALHHLHVAFIFVVVADALGREDVVVRAVLDAHVLDVGPEGEAEVRGKRPGRGRPREDVRRAVGEIEAAAGVGDAEAHGDRGVVDFLVAAEVHLEVGQRRREHGVVGQDVVALVDQAAVPQLLEDPPDGLHEVGVHRAVLVVEVDPAAHALDGLAPLGGVAQHDAPAGLVELRHAVGLDLRLARDAELLFHLVLDGQAVAVPAEAALDALSFHGLVARKDVLDGAGREVAEVGQPRGKGRAVVEHELGRVPAVLDRAVKGVVFAPEREDPLLHLRKAHAGIDRLVHSVLRNWAG